MLFVVIISMSSFSCRRDELRHVAIEIPDDYNSNSGSHYEVWWSRVRMKCGGHNVIQTKV